MSQSHLPGDVLFDRNNHGVIHSSIIFTMGLDCLNHREGIGLGRNCSAGSGRVRPASFGSSDGDLCDFCSEEGGTQISSTGGNSTSGQNSAGHTEASSSVSNEDGDSVNTSFRKKPQTYSRKTSERETANKSGRSSISATNAIPTPERHRARRRYTQPPKSEFLNVKRCETIQDAIKLTYGHGSLSPKNLAAFWSHLAQLMPSECEIPDISHENQEDVERELKMILEVTMQELNKFGPKELSGTVLGMAKVVKLARATRCDRSLCRLQDLFEELFFESGSQERNRVFYAIANTAQTMSRFNFRDLSNLAYAYALVGYLPVLDGGGTLFDHIIWHALVRLKSFNSQGLSSLVWSCAKLGVSHPRFFDEVADAIMERNLTKFNQQDLSNIVWAYAVTGEVNPHLFKRVSGAVLARDLGTFDPQHLSVIVWGYATAGELSPRLSKRVADAIIASDLKMFGPRALTNVLWSFAAAGRPYPHLFDKIADAIIARDLNSFNPQGLSIVVWAYATAGKTRACFFVRLFRLFTKVAESIVARDLRTFEPQDLSNIAWAFAVSNVAAPNLFGNAFVAALNEKYREFDSRGLSQLYQWHLWQHELRTYISLPPILQILCRQAFVSQNNRSSQLQSEVFVELSALGLQPRNEVLMRSGYRLDALVKVYGHDFGVEVDGPLDFNSGEGPTARTTLKRRQVLNIDGVLIVSVPHWEWIAFGNNRINKQQYLRSKLGI